MTILLKHLKKEIKCSNSHCFVKKSYGELTSCIFKLTGFFSFFFSLPLYQSSRSYASVFFMKMSFPNPKSYFHASQLKCIAVWTMGKKYIWTQLHSNLYQYQLPSGSSVALQSLLTGRVFAQSRGQLQIQYLEEYLGCTLTPLLAHHLDQITS